MTLEDALQKKKEEIIDTVGEAGFSNSQMLLVDDLLTEFITLAVEAQDKPSAHELADALSILIDPVTELQLQMNALLIAAFGGRNGRTR